MFLCVALAVLESSVEQAILDLPTSTSQVLGLKAAPPPPQAKILNLKTKQNKKTKNNN